MNYIGWAYIATLSVALVINDFSPQTKDQVHYTHSVRIKKTIVQFTSFVLFYQDSGVLLNAYWLT